MYQAFLSHYSGDKPAVETLAKRLEEKGISCFLDKWHLIPGEPWQEALEKALNESKTCVVFIGPSGLGPWQNEEMRAAISRRVSDSSRTFRVVPVVLPGAQRDPRSRLPTFLVAATWVEFADLFDDDAFHRLKCGIKGVAPGPSPGEALYSGECPYRGLEVFNTEHARFFFGRESQVDWMIERLAGGFGTPREHRFLSVVGASGSGKSSLVRAGLVAALQDGRSRNGKSIAHSREWPVVLFKPGSEPLKALADALWNEELTQPIVTDALHYADQLKNDQRRLHATIGTVLHRFPETHRCVVVVDQFEELCVLSASVKNLPAEFGGCRGYRTRPAAGHRAAVAPRRSQAAQETRATEVGTRMAWDAEVGTGAARMPRFETPQGSMGKRARGMMAAEDVSSRNLVGLKMSTGRPANEGATADETCSRTWILPPPDH